jgi:hypothetical protein
VIPYVDPDDLEGPSIEFDSPSPPASPPARTLCSLDEDEEEGPSNVTGNVKIEVEAEAQLGETSKPGAAAATTLAKEVPSTHFEQRSANPGGDPESTVPNAVVKTERIEEDRLPAPKDSNVPKECFVIGLTLDSETSEGGEEEEEGGEEDGDGDEESEAEEDIGAEGINGLSDLSDVPDDE